MRALGVDYLVAGSHRWLIGAEGVAALYIAPERRARLCPVVRRWLSHEDGLAFLWLRVWNRSLTSPWGGRTDSVPERPSAPRAERNPRTWTGGR